MPAPKLKNIYRLLGKPVASSTPIKELFDIDREHFPNVETKTNQEQSSRNHKMFYPNSASACGHQVEQYTLEIVSSDSDSDSDIMPCKKAKLISPKGNQPVAASSIRKRARDVGKKKQLEKALVVKKHKVVRATVGGDGAIESDSNAITSRIPRLHKILEPSSKSSAGVNADVVNHKDSDGLQRKSKRPGLRPSISPSIKSLAVSPGMELSGGLHLTSLKKNEKGHNGRKKMNSQSIVSPSPGVIRRGGVTQEPKGNLRMENNSSSDNSAESNIEDLDKHDDRSLRDTRKSEKCHLASKSPAKNITKMLTVNLSSASHKQNKNSENTLKKITTPVTGMPPARARQSLCRTLSRISASASASDKFMVEIPKGIADSFSSSLQLIKRRIDFEAIDEHKKQRLYVGETDQLQYKTASFKGIEKKQYRHKKKGEQRRETLKKMFKSPQETNTATVPRKITALKLDCSPVKELETNEPKTAIKGVRKSLRTRTAPISYWKGPNSEQEDSIFSQNRPRKKCNSLLPSTSLPPNKKNELKKSSSLQNYQVNKIKDSTKQMEKTEPGKRLRQKEDSSKELRELDISNQMKVCCSTFSQSVFVPSDDEEDGDEIGVRYATSLQTFDMQSNFIRLLPGAKTTDLFSHSYSQLYTVLENTVCLYAEDVPKQFDMHSQFYVQKDVSHKVFNNSNESSLLLQVKIQN